MEIIGYDYDGRLSFREIKELSVVSYDTQTRAGLYRIKASYRNCSDDYFYIDKGPLDSNNWEKRIFDNLDDANLALEEMIAHTSKCVIDLRRTNYIMTSISGLIQTVRVSNESDCFDECEDKPLLVKIVEE